MKHAARTAVTLAIGLSIVITVSAGCSSGTSSLPPLSSVGSTDVAPSGGRNLGTIPPSSTSPAETLPLGSTVATSTAPTPASACTFDAIHASTGPSPTGITDIDLRCEGDWASWVGQANDPTTSDGYFAVAKRTATGWETINLGTAGVCSDGGVPQELWTALNCTE